VLHIIDLIYESKHRHPNRPGFLELEALGMIDSRRPKMLCVQSEVTAPLVRAFESGAADTTAAAAGQTLATGLNVPGGVGHFRVLQIIHAET
jgi:threonine synthase